MALKGQNGAAAFHRWTAVLALFLVLTVTGLEAIHVHPERPAARESGMHCLICISVHANAPTITTHALPVLLAVAIAAITYEVTGQSLAARLELFTRPPPVAPAGPAA